MMFKLNHMRNLRQQGFTLVELLIVVIILSILAAIVVPQFARSTSDAKLGALDANLATLRAAVEVYKQQHGAYPSAKAATVGLINSKDAFVEQLTQYSDADGATAKTATATIKYGPYLRRDMPAEPVSGKADMEIITTGTLGMTATAGDPGGWKFDNKSGELIANTAANQAR